MFVLVLIGDADVSGAQMRTVGINISLEPDSSTLSIGDTTVFRTTMTSSMPDSMKVHVGWIPYGPAVERGMTYRVVKLEEDGTRRRIPLRRFVDCCGSRGQKPIVIILEKKHPRLFLCEAWIGKWNDGRTYLFLSADSGYQVEPPCKLAIRAQQHARISHYFPELKYFTRELEMAEPYWVGDIESNEVILDIDDTGENRVLSN